MAGVKHGNSLLSWGATGPATSNVHATVQVTLSRHANNAQLRVQAPVVLIACFFSRLLTACVLSQLNSACCLLQVGHLHMLVLMGRVA